ncbi:MAG: twin-arginine translocase TatA/TatE family subunit [Actinomycetes bacterium]
MFEGLLSPMHILVILVIVAIFFGAKRLPELGKGLGSGIREFKSGLSEIHSDVTEAEPAPTATPAPEGPKLLTAQATPVAADAGPAATDAPFSSAATQETL